MRARLAECTYWPVRTGSIPVYWALPVPRGQQALLESLTGLVPGHHLGLYSEAGGGKATVPACQRVCGIRNGPELLGATRPSSGRLLM